jgi:hypothetical protein
MLQPVCWFFERDYRLATALGLRPRTIPLRLMAFRTMCWQNAA